MISWNIEILHIVILAVILFRANNESTDQTGWLRTQFCTLNQIFCNQAHINTVQHFITLYLGSIGMDHVISKSGYKGKILQTEL